MPATDSQTAEIHAHLKRGQSITPLEALDLYGIARLGARIYDLRHHHGLPITSSIIKVKTNRGKTSRVASYRLED